VRQQLARYADSSGWYIQKATKTKRERTIVLHEPFLSALRAHKKAQDKPRSAGCASEDAQPATASPSGGSFPCRIEERTVRRAARYFKGLPPYRPQLSSENSRVFSS